MCTYRYHNSKPAENALIVITVPETACYRYHSPRKLSTGGGVALTLPRPPLGANQEETTPVEHNGYRVQISMGDKTEG